jgi:membrane-associated phospholipid phosphatase
MWQPYYDKIKVFDELILRLLVGRRKPYKTYPLLIFTYSGTGQAWVAFSLLAYALHWGGIHFVPEQGVFLRALFCPLLSWAIGVVIKRKVSRRRPVEGLTDFQGVISPPGCASFPSSHASASISFFLFLVWSQHPLALWAGAWAALVSYSRIYLGVHYPTDIMGGAVVGTISALIISMLTNH